MTATIDHLSWLSADVALAVARFEATGASEPQVAVARDGWKIEAESRSVWFGRSHGLERAILTLWIDAVERDGQDLEVSLRCGREGASLGPAPASSLGVDLRTLIREDLAPLPRNARERVLELCLGALTQHRRTVDRGTLSGALLTLRDALREPYPRCGLSREEPQSLHVDYLIRLDERSFFIRGWMRDEQAPVVRLTAVSPEGARVELLEGLFRVRRPDVDRAYATPTGEENELGFLCHFTLDAPSYLPRGWILELENAAGIATEAEAPEAMRDPVEARETIVAGLARERGPGTALMDHVVPAVSLLQERLARAVEIADVEQLGDAPEAPEISIVVPLYERVDLLQHQLAQFAADRQLRRADLIYVLDSPEFVDALMVDAVHLHELYRVPFRVAKLSRNGGFAVANNRGASLARGRLLLLLNSDVVPAAPGWLERLTDFYDSAPNVGALGPKLLFEDGSLQHAGLYFRRAAPWAAWENAHFFKGLHGDLPAANVARPVPAVTAACLMIRLDLYRELGGLRSSFIQGDYEDSDLCLRLREAGYDNWYLPEVELYHLEGSSYATAARHANARYNTWLHTCLWGERIERLMAEEAPVEGAITFANP